MADRTPDETPEAPPVEAAEEPTVETPEKPEHVPDPTPNDSMPAWAKELSDRLDALSEKVMKAPEGVREAVEDTPPVKLPWHKRSLFGDA